MKLKRKKRYGGTGSYAKYYFPHIKPKVKPGVVCPRCTVLGSLWVYVPDGRILCYGCGYALPERYEEPL